ncbi:NUDIX domain-containing protein [Secundilactobacillus similis]|uniref:NAD(+) diphosphatase n=1 Tax=Secundilactobacillus similis DSM 23365 = JCM 2765 TaxID=1423804 RepID=A0A0R2FC84_9LACO|nr:NUDIX domain-containing protein [Secundilactobacillus similis]KRN22381.1 NUDIX family hydrolase [Secundilactobacillus similis DSM 23365 = JCM 2765]
MTYQFCPTCGTKLIAKVAGDDGETPFCPHCDRYWFPIFASCVMVLVADQYHDVALVKMPYLSKQYESLISGYIKPGETAEIAAVREVQEELGVHIDHLQYAGTHWFGPNSELMHGFIAVIDKTPLTKSAELSVAHWVPAAKVPDVMFPETPDNAAYKVFRRYLKLL